MKFTLILYTFRAPKGRTWRNITYPKVRDIINSIIVNDAVLFAEILDEKGRGWLATEFTDNSLYPGKPVTN